ncbi:hypothetical protein [Okeania sp. SIO2G5]|uniref:hypothetical protein n=1 Tax=Okeania sp. SIO2G5 TaxID=2607796 RepID=UPI0013C1CA0E|nr:hypothetical protein [Okeania sp. SIO2G5]NEP76172.1 hypothetical protein [Okeania sp. SIO2G5]
MQSLYAFTTHRPWSHAIAHWGKDIENRSNCCRIVPPGNLIAIHAGQKWDQHGAEWMKPYVGRGVVQGPENYPTGIVAIARFLGNIVPDKDCGELEVYRDSAWYQGGVGWVLADVMAIAPVSCPGQQGIWKINDANPKSPQLLSRVRDAYKEAIAA